MKIPSYKLIALSKTEMRTRLDLVIDLSKWVFGICIASFWNLPLNADEVDIAVLCFCLRIRRYRR